MPATTFGKNILPRVAGLLDEGMVSDVIEIVDTETYKRPIYAGNALATVTVTGAVQLLTVRTKNDYMLEKSDQCAITKLERVFENSLTTFISDKKHGGDRPELASADVVISGGRGLQDKATFERIEKIADKLDAAVGASRAAVDSGLAPNDYQVGQTGQIVSPKLYFALGISGAIQHIAGMKDSGAVVAINKDPDAPIFEIADYGLVADLADVLLDWENYLKKKEV